MNFEEYQSQSRKTAIYLPEVAITYPTMKLAAEAGEVANKVGKLMLADGHLVVPSLEQRAEILKECGDVLWYLSNICTDLGASLNDVALNNLMKLKSRQERGELIGSGDNR